MTKRMQLSEKASIPGEYRTAAPEAVVREAGAEADITAAAAGPVMEAEAADIKHNRGISCVWCRTFVFPGEKKQFNAAGTFSG